MATFSIVNKQVKAEGLIPGSIDDSIAKWKYVKEHLSEIHDSGDGGPHSCALCLKYYSSAGCEGCPISEYTGQEACMGTPYTDWLWAMSLDQDRRVVVQREIAFLHKVKKSMEKK